VATRGSCRNMRWR